MRFTAPERERSRHGESEDRVGARRTVWVDVRPEESDRCGPGSGPGDVREASGGRERPGAQHAPGAAAGEVAEVSAVR